jgi:hypothetical protein
MQGLAFFTVETLAQSMQIPGVDERGFGLRAVEAVNEGADTAREEPCRGAGEGQTGGREPPMAQNRAKKRGNDSMAMSPGQAFHICPKMSSGRSAEGETTDGQGVEPRHTGCQPGSSLRPPGPGYPACGP